MSRVIVGSYMVRYPLGGMMSWVLQYLVGFQRLGHDVYFVEKAGYPDSCYDPVRGVMSDDCTEGVRIVGGLLSRFGLGGKWCFVDAGERYYGLDRRTIEAVFSGAELFIDMGTHGSWAAEASTARRRVLIDGEPAFTQMKMELRTAAGETLPAYDHYYTTGQNIGTSASTAPDGGRLWHALFHPVVVDLFPPSPAPADAPFTTVMNWRSHAPLTFAGRTYGQKDVEFAKFIDLPRHTQAPLEIAVAGNGVPRAELEAAGWRLTSAHAVTVSYDAFVNYIRASRGEFTVCKSVFVVTNSGWFSDRSAVYLACGRPVVIQETGFAKHLPCGEGLIAVASMEQAAAALDSILSDYARHSRAARSIAIEHLDAVKVLARFLDELDLPRH